MYYRHWRLGWKLHVPISSDNLKLATLTASLIKKETTRWLKEIPCLHPRYPMRKVYREGITSILAYLHQLLIYFKSQFKLVVITLKALRTGSGACLRARPFCRRARNRNVPWWCLPFEILCLWRYVKLFLHLASDFSGSLAPGPSLYLCCFGLPSYWNLR